MIERDKKEVERILHRLLTRRGQRAERAGCPPEEDLAGYLSGTFPEHGKSDVEAHFADCSFCLEEVIAAYKAAQESCPEEARRQLVERVMALVPVAQAGPAFFDLVVRLVKDSVELVSTTGRLIPTAAPVGVRGKPKSLEAALLQLEKEMGRLKVGVEVEAVEAGLCEVIVRVKDAGGRAAEGIRLTLFSKGREQASYLTRQGEAVFDRIPQGEYNLAVSDSGTSVGTVRLRIIG